MTDHPPSALCHFVILFRWQSSFESVSDRLSAVVVDTQPSTCPVWLSSQSLRRSFISCRLAVIR